MEVPQRYITRGYLTEPLRQPHRTPLVRSCPSHNTHCTQVSLWVLSPPQASLNPAIRNLRCTLKLALFGRYLPEQEVPVCLPTTRRYYDAPHRVQHGNWSATLGSSSAVTNLTYTTAYLPSKPSYRASVMAMLESTYQLSSSTLTSLYLSIHLCIIFFRHHYKLQLIHFPFPQTNLICESESTRPRYSAATPFILPTLHPPSNTTKFPFHLLSRPFLAFFSLLRKPNLRSDWVRET
ncbi:hypothetical protein F4678DRAFT_226815 [Xylaria arbuscula]|nr:hypothetical protein F4678DRAFT_226815 [Xylaria arbuscula]